VYELANSNHLVELVHGYNGDCLCKHGVMYFNLWTHSCQQCRYSNVSFIFHGHPIVVIDNWYLLISLLSTLEIQGKQLV